MHTSMIWLALTGLAAPVEGAPTVLTWKTNYYQARRQAVERKKPLAVFFSAGRRSWGKLAKEGKLSPEIRRVLADRYVLVHVNTATRKGRVLARRFDIDNGLGLVIGDRSGRFQAFRHEGRLDDEDLARHLEHHGKRKQTPRSTETHTGKRVSRRYALPKKTRRSSRPVTHGWMPPSYGYVPSFSGGSCST